MTSRTVTGDGAAAATRLVLQRAASALTGRVRRGTDPHRTTPRPTIDRGPWRLGRAITLVSDRLRTRREEPVRDDLLRAGQEPDRPRTSIVALINGGRGPK